MKFLVAGWFSFEQGHATAGDLLARDLVTDWLASEGHRFDVAVARPFTDGVDVRVVNPSEYSHVILVCGPFERGELEHFLLKRFWRSRLIGLDLSMQTPIDEWQPFDFLIERDSTRAVRPDLVFATKQKLVPVVGVCLVEDYPRGQTAFANAAIARLIETHHVASVRIDTRLDRNDTGFRTPAEIESVIARTDVLVTTRLHGMVMALKNGVPALAIDPEPGGAKIRRQAEALGWRAIFDVSGVSDAALSDAFRYCLTRDARHAARKCSDAARSAVNEVRATFLNAVGSAGALEHHYRNRVGADPEFPGWDAGSDDNNHADASFGRKIKAVIPSPIRERVKRWIKPRIGPVLP